MIYLVASMLAVVLSFALTPVVARLALSLGAIDQPGGRKIHSQPIARLGGLAMAISFLVVVLICVPINRELLGLVGGVVILVAVGVVDDVDVRPRLADGRDQCLGHTRLAHLGLEVVRRHLRARDEHAFLARLGRLAAPVKEERDVRVLLRLGDMELPKAGA